MSRIKLVILPQIDNAGGDITKQWFIYYSYRNPQTGKMKRFKVYKGLGIMKTYEDRMQAATQIRDDITEKLKNGWSPFDDEKSIYEDQLQYNHVSKVYTSKRAAVRSFNFFANIWLKQKSSLESSSIADYTSKLRTFQYWLEKNNYESFDISEISNEIMLLFFEYLKNTRQSSRSTYNKYKRYLSAVFDLVIKEKAIQYNPVYQIPDNRRINDQTPRPIHDDDLEKFKEELKKHPQLWLAVNFQYYCYLRPGIEVRKLKVKQIDFSRGTILIPKNVAKTKHDKIVVIPDPFLKILREEYRIHRYDKNFYVLGKNGEPGKECWGKNYFRYKFNEVRDKLDMPLEYKFYSWKHTGNVRAEDANIPLTDRQQQNGHRYPSTTENYTKNKKGHYTDVIRTDFPKL